LRREAKLLMDRSIDSLVLAIEHFNRPYDRGRAEIVLRNLNHAFEMLLKAAILHRGGRIWKRGEKQTIGFESCINLCLLDERVKFLTNDQATVLRLLNALRDAAEHHLVLLSELELYSHSQAGVTLFEDILRGVFEKSLANYVPTRVLPISTTPPKDLYMVVDEKFRQVRELLRPKRRQKFQAMVALRSLELIDRAVRENPNQPTDHELNDILRSVKKGRPWQKLFPGIASINFATEGTGLTVKLRITKAEGMPVRLVKEGEESTVIAVKRVDELSYYSLGLRDLAEKANLGQNRTLAVVRFLKLQDDSACFKEIVIGKTRFKRYSPESLKRVKEALPALDMEKVWNQFGPGHKAS